MTVTHRRVLYLTFIAVFAAVAPLFLLSVQGYRYDRSSHRFLKTGLVSVDADPRPDRVYLDGSLRRTPGRPMRVSSVAPGNHVLRLEKDGYRSWEQSVSVYAGRSTTLLDVRLVRDAAAEELARNTTAFALAGDQRRLALLSASDTVTFLDLGSGSSSSFTVPTGQRPDGLSWSPSGNALYLHFPTGTRHSVLVNPPDGQFVQIPAVPLSALVDWNPLRPNHLLALDGQTLFDVDSASGAVITVDDSVVDWAAFGNALVVLKNADGQAALFNAAGDEPLSSGIGATSRLLRTAPVLSVLDPDRQTLTVFQRGEPLQQTAFSRITQAVWQPGGSLIAMANDMEVYLRRYPFTSLEPALFNRFGTSVKLLWWSSSLRALFIAHGKTLELWEATLSGPRQTYTLLSESVVQGAEDADGNALVRTEDGKIFRIRL